MLTERELSTINTKATKSFLAESYQSLVRHVTGEDSDDYPSLEVFLYTYALGMYELGAITNFLSVEQVNQIYSRLREISNI